MVQTSLYIILENVVKKTKSKRIKVSVIDYGKLEEQSQEDRTEGA